MMNLELTPILSSWSGNDTPLATILFFAGWFGPSLAAAVATSWLSGRRGRGSVRGVAVGVGVALVVGLMTCGLSRLPWVAPVCGVVGAVVTVLRTE